MPTLTYSNQKGFIGNRPYADVILVHGTLQSSIYSCLVDTGSDYTILPAGALSQVMLAVPTGAGITVTTAGAAVTYPLLSNATLIIEGKQITANILIDTANSQICILGRTDLLAAYDAGFWISPTRMQEWLW